VFSTRHPDAPLESAACDPQKVHPVEKLKVYIAASADSTSTSRVRAAIAVLNAHGFVITCTWPDVVAKVGSANPRDASAVDRRGWSAQDLLEVDAADAVWFLVPEPPLTTRGGWFEAGYAHATNKHLVFSGDTKQSVFCALGHEVASDEAAVRQLLAIRTFNEMRHVEAGLRELAEAEVMDLTLKAALTGDVE
jgi:nucleoside 2-deoxyribosyltransferase